MIRRLNFGAHHSVNAQNGHYRFFVQLIMVALVVLCPHSFAVKKILLTGLPATVDPERLKARLEAFGQVIRVNVIVDGAPEQPWVIVEMDLDLAATQAVARRIDGIYYIDRFIGAHVMTHD